MTKVLYITPNGVANRSPQIDMAEFLSQRFEKLDLLVYGTSRIPDLQTRYDVVFAAMEACIPYAYEISQKMGIPIYSHWEWIPPFRIFGYPGGDDPLKWGFQEGDAKHLYKNKSFYSKYDKIIKCSINSNINSCAGVSFKESAVKFSNNKMDNCFIKYPHATINLNKERNNKKRNYFITVSRLVPNKLVYKIAEAVRCANLKTTWVIVGSGPEQHRIENLFKDSNTEVKFFSNINGEKKYTLLSGALFQLSAWHGLPQLEAALVGVPTINYNIEYIKELYGDTLVWVDNEKEMSEKIKELFSVAIGGKSLAYLSDPLYESATNNLLNINTMEQSADIIEETLRKIL